MDGQPFLMIKKEIDPGVLEVLEDEIVPRLESEIPALQVSFVVQYAVIPFAVRNRK